jgi:hypothetical protein
MLVLIVGTDLARNIIEMLMKKIIILIKMANFQNSHVICAKKNFQLRNNIAGMVIPVVKFSREGYIQNWKDFCLKINIPRGNY